MDDLKTQIKSIIKGDVDASPETLQKFSHDASMFELVPKVVVFPKDAEDIKSVINFVSSRKGKFPGLSITARSAGTDMSGAAINQSILLDFTRYFNQTEMVDKSEARVQPGV